MKEDWNSVPEEQRAALEKTMEKMEQASQPETWFDGNKVNDVLFCEDFLAGHLMKCIHGTFFDVNGAIGDAEQIKAEIYHKIAPYVTSNIAKKATSLLDALRIRCYSPPIPFQTDRIHVANGTYFLSKNFSAQKEFCINRLPVRYVPDAPEPSRWLIKCFGTARSGIFIFIREKRAEVGGAGASGIFYEAPAEDDKR